jgi:copper chaperone CopZ
MSNEAKLLKIVGENHLDCGMCENRLRFALKQLPGIQQVQASCSTQLIKVVFDPQLIGLSNIRQLLAEMEYEVAEADLP